MKTPRKRGRPPLEAPQSPAERMRRMRERRRASGMRAVTMWVPVQTAATLYSSHRQIEARSLALHAAIVRKIERDPSLLEVAHRNLNRWRAQSSGESPAWVAEWRELLRRPWLELAAILTELSEYGARVRQSSPFAGVLTEAERVRVYEAFQP
jgi:hypothetical protein